jgi:serine/threonine protein kinase
MQRFSYSSHDDHTYSAPFAMFATQVDIYSFGVISYELLTGCIPFRGMNRNEFDLRVVREGFRPSLKVDDVGRQVIMTDRVRDLVQSCWHADFTQRQRASGLLHIISKDLELERQRVEQMGICGALSGNLIVRRNAI